MKVINSTIHQNPKRRNHSFGITALFISLLALTQTVHAQQAQTEQDLNEPRLIESVTNTRDRQQVSLAADFGLEGHQVSGKANEANVFGASGALDFTHQTSKTLQLQARGGFKLEEGTSETIFPDQAGASFQPKSSLFLDYAEVNYGPTTWLKIKAGAINQEYHQNSLFLTDTPFVGARETLNYGQGPYELNFHLLQSLPSNHTLSQRLGEVQQGSSRFYSETVELKINDANHQGHVSAGHFAYDQLSPSIAYNSRLLGNSVDGLGKENNQFLYNYMGWNTTVSYLYKGLGRHLIGGYGSYHINTSAPEGRNVGRKLGVRYGYLFSAGTLNLELEGFENQSDSTVAYYADKTYGFVNREGFGAKVSFDNIRDDYELEAKAIQTSPILESPLQEEETIISISLRKTYDIL